MPDTLSGRNGLATFQYLASNDPNKLVVFAMDGKKAKLPTGVSDWEQREPGSLTGVLNAYAYCLDKINQKAAFTTADIVNIHDRCVDKVAGTNYDKVKRQETRPINKALRTFSENSSFTFIPNVNLSVAGCKGAAEYIWQNMIDHQDPEYMFHQVSNAKDIEEILKSYVNTNQEEFGAPAVLPFIDGLTETNDNQTIPTRIQSVLDSLYQQLNEISDGPNADSLKITAIVAAVQELERIHPFQDANCRTFCLVLLNSLLMQQGLEPAIIDDPNKFDGFSVAELVETVKQGMQETCKLVDGTYEQEYYQQASTSSEEQEEDPSYDGYYYLTDNSDDSEDSDQDDHAQNTESDAPETDTCYTDHLCQQLDLLAKKESVVENFKQIKAEVQDMKHHAEQALSSDSSSCVDGDRNPLINGAGR